jgi:hypothetical protein
MNFSISKPDFTKYFTSETKYSIAITADESITKKFPVLEDGPLEVTLFWRTQFDELAQLKNFNAANKFTKQRSTPPASVEMPRTSGLMPTMMLCPTMKILLKLASGQCGLPSLSTTEHPTKLPKDYETF